MDDENVKVDFETAVYLMTANPGMDQAATKVVLTEEAITMPVARFVTNQV